DIKVIAYPDTNSLLVKGTTEQVRFIEKLARALDVPKRHVELSLWIIDLDKGDLDQLGVNW
ncbi:EscC/YscC/HrcC family type III secretion system outer membrane ring protein, partial [Chromobacterium piscinae]